MTAVQKVIKYLAMAFAVFLSVNIIGGIIMLLAGAAFFLSDGGKEFVGEMQTHSIDGDISTLSIKLSGAELKIKASDKFSLESNCDYINVNTDNGMLCISETRKMFSSFPKGITVILSIPEDFVFADVKIETGAGEVEIDALSAETLSISLGAGEATINNLTANSHADIEGGAGELNIDGGLLRNLELDMGVGELTLKSRIEGQSKIDCGVGESEITLLGSSEDYQIEIDKGIGEAKIDGKSMHDDEVYGKGNNRIEIDSGVGSIDIVFSMDEIQKAA